MQKITSAIGMQLPKDIDKTAMELGIKPKKKVEPFIWGFLIGMALQWAIILFAIKPFASNMYWSMFHPEEMKWAIDRYNVIQKASKVLYFESQMDGVTIVKPQSMQ